MILFKPEHVELILTGAKTQTRRIWKKPRCKVGSVHKAKTKMLSKEFFAELYIVGTRKEHLLDISEMDAALEGNYTIDGYLEKWDEINPKYPSSTDPVVDVVVFNLTQETVYRRSHNGSTIN